MLFADVAADPQALATSANAIGVIVRIFKVFIDQSLRAKMSI